MSRSRYCPLSSLSYLRLTTLHTYPADLFLSRFEWSIVRGVMGVEIGRPRRFSPAFLVAERMKLQAYRTTKRLCSAPSSSMLCENTKGCPSSLVQVGDVVSVCDMKTCTIAKGLVLSTIEPQPVRQQRSSRGKHGNHYQHNTSSSSHSYQQHHHHHQWETRKAFLVQLDRQELGIEVYDDIDIAIIHNSTKSCHNIRTTVGEEEEEEENVGMICEDITDEDVTNLLVFSRQLGMVEHARERYHSLVEKLVLSRPTIHPVNT